VTSLDLTDAQLNELFARISGYLEFQHRLLARLQALGFPEDDELHRASRTSVLALRELYLTLNDGRRKGVSHQAQKRADAWPPL
jgi:hypothetical protein